MARKQLPPMNADLRAYFALRTSPMENSPVGRLMQAIVNDSPGIEFEDARQMAQNSLVNASKRNNYRVMTPAQEEKSRLAARKAFKK